MMKMQFDCFITAQDWINYLLHYFVKHLYRNKTFLATKHKSMFVVSTTQH